MVMTAKVAWIFLTIPAVPAMSGVKKTPEKKVTMVAKVPIISNQNPAKDKHASFFIRRDTKSKRNPTIINAMGKCTNIGCK